MTLLELMLVLALMVMIGALVVPSLRGPFENYRLRKAGELVRVQWTKARVRAMKTGQIQMFQFAPGQSEFTIQPYYTEQDYLETDLEHSPGGQLSGGSGVAPTGPLDPGSMPAGSPSSDAPAMQGDWNHRLPDGVVFVGGMVKSDTRTIQIEQQTQDGLALMTGGTEPILFYPDGTTSDAEVSLSNDQQQYIRVTLRGLTGTVKVSRLMTAEEWQQVEQALETSNAFE